MNKERSKMFAQKMKEVFRSKSHHSESIPKIPRNLECESKQDTGKDPFHQNINNVNFNPESKFANCCNSSSRIFTIPENSKGGSTVGSGEWSANCTDSLNQEELWGNLKRQLTNNSSGKCLSEEKRYNYNDSVSSRSNEQPPPTTTATENNHYRHASHFGPNTNRSSAGSLMMMICDRKLATQKPMLSESNLNLNTDALRGRCSVCKCNLATCRQQCPNDVPICANDVIATNNNYLFNSLPAKTTDSSLFSAVMKYAFGGEKSNRNDFIILALGIHHYVKEVFNALDSNNNGYIHYEELQILCKLLGKDLQNLDKSFSCSNVDMNNANKKSCGNNSCEIHLHFGKFSELICNIFGQETDSNCLEKRKNTQLVNAVVNITRRNESLNVISKQLEELENGYLTLTSSRDFSTVRSVNQTVKERCKTWGKEQQNKYYHVDANENICLENLKLQKIVLLQQQELQCLREVIEDLRVSLQCSDAENLSLRVREAKTKNRSYFESSSERVASRRSSRSTDDGRDSIDRLILSFPSTDQLNMDSSESLLSIGSSNRSTPDRQLSSTPQTVSKQDSSETQTSTESLMSTDSSKNWSTLRQRSSFPPQSKRKKETDENPESPWPTLRSTASHKRVEDDFSLEKEIQMAYEKLSMTRIELEETRKDLENSVAEIRTQNSLMEHLRKNLTDAEKRADSFSRENEDLKEKVVFLQMEEENNKIQMESIVEDLAALKAQLVAKNKDISNLSQELEHLKTKRQNDLKQLSEARSVVATSLLRAKRNEEELKALLRTSRQSEQFPVKSKFSSHGSPENASKFLPLAGKCLTLDNNNNKRLRPPTTSKCNDSGHLNATSLNTLNNFISSFSNDCNNTVIKGTNNSDYCSSKKYPRIICYEETISNEERNRSNASPYDVRRSEFDTEKRGSIQEPTKGDRTFPAETNNQRIAAKPPKEIVPPSPFDTTGPEKVLIGSPLFREKGTVLMSPHNEDKPTMEVKPHLIKPIAITIPLPKEPSLSDSSTKRSKAAQLKELTVYENESRVIAKKSNDEYGGSFLFNEKDLTLKFSKTFQSPCNDLGFQTSTQILEGLEAEVEFLRKSLDDPLLG